METINEPLHLNKLSLKSKISWPYFQALFESLLFTKFLNMAMVRIFEVMFGQTLIYHV
jgi:hypothetical protein